MLFTSSLKNRAWPYKAILPLISTIGLGGCTLGTPSCADPDTVSLIRQIVEKQIDTVSEALGKANPGLEGSNNWRSRIKIVIENIRTMAHDQSIDKYECIAVLRGEQIGKPPATTEERREEIAIASAIIGGDSAELHYTSETMADSNRQYVEILNPEVIATVYAATSFGSGGLSK
jgi:hypothetical protein